VSDFGGESLNFGGALISKLCADIKVFKESGQEFLEKNLEICVCSVMLFSGETWVVGGRWGVETRMEVCRLKKMLRYILLLSLLSVWSCSASVWQDDRLARRTAEAYAGWLATRRDDHRVIGDEDLRTFQEVASYILKYYVEEVDAEDLLRAAKEKALELHKDPTVVDDWDLVKTGIEGMLSVLDKYSVFFDAEENRLFDEMIQGEFGGLGIEIGEHERGVEVKRVLASTPAERSGMEAGDVIVEAGGEDLEGMSTRGVVLRLRGKKGTEVLLKVWRPSEHRALSMKIRREVIQERSVEGEWLDKNLWLKIRDFHYKTSGELTSMMASLEERGDARGLVLDLRGNRGGSFVQSVRVSDYFLDYGMIVFTEDRNKKRFYARGESPDRTFHRPMVVLIDEDSASASEIVAGAMRDRDRAVLVGDKSFGKGSVQNKYNLSRGMGLKLTTQHYYTPLGHSVNAGIVPDVEVEDDPDREGDEQLEAALGILEKLSTYSRDEEVRGEG
jgi:carboxyl-terminal processing protease